jgi:hypothetical protein
MTFDPKDFESVTCPRCRTVMPIIFQDKQTGLCRECKAEEKRRLKREREYSPPDIEFKQDFGVKDDTELSSADEVR